MSAGQKRACRCCVVKGRRRGKADRALPARERRKIFPDEPDALRRDPLRDLFHVGWRMSPGRKVRPR